MTYMPFVLKYLRFAQLLQTFHIIPATAYREIGNKSIMVHSHQN